MFYRRQLNKNTVKHNYKFIVKMCLCSSPKGVLSGFYNKAEKVYYKLYPWYKPYFCTVHFVESLQLLTNNCTYINST